MAFNHVMQSTGALAVLHVGFVMTLANLSFFTVFATSLMLSDKKGPSQAKAKTYFHVLCESGFALNVAFFYLMEVGFGQL